MEQRAHEFWKGKHYAVVGVSSQKTKFGFTVYQEIKKHGYTVYAVNKKGNSIGGDASYTDLKSLPSHVDGVIVIVPPRETEKVLQTCADLNIHNVWIQQGAESKEAIRFCDEHKMNVVHHRCALMYLKPRQFPHSFHYWMHSLFSKRKN